MISATMADPIEETVAYRDGVAVAVADDDGFPEVDDLPGRVLAQYHLGPILGKGTMGRVYRAEHLGLGRPCAIKVMNPGLVDHEPQVRERFWAEARAVANLVHPHVVTVHNLGSDRGYHFIEMEYVPGGGTLKEALVKHGAFDPLRASVLVREVVLALGAAHSAGLVHRDVKPSNVLLTADGRAKLADFGLVRRHGDLEVAGSTVAGTPTYMAPELFGGVPSSPSSDIYAVGVMYYYLLTARLPFASDRIIDLVRLHRAHAIPDARAVAPEVPEAVAAILDRCLAKAPAGRYADADELAEALQLAIHQMRDPDALIRDSLEGVDCLVQGGHDNYRLTLPLPGDRIQEVFLEFHDGRRGERLLSIFSVCAPADPKDFEFALKLNAELSHGALSMRRIHDAAMLVMTRTFDRDRVRPEDVRAAILEIARRGDWVEKRLTNVDMY